MNSHPVTWISSRAWGALQTWRTWQTLSEKIKWKIIEMNQRIKIRENSDTDKKSCCHKCKIDNSRKGQVVRQAPQSAFPMEK